MAYSWFLKHRDAAGENLINPMKITQGVNLIESEGGTFDNALFATSEMFEVSPTSTYEGHSSDAQILAKVCFYDLQGIFTSGLNGWLSSFTVPSGSYFCRVTFKSIIDGVDPYDTGLTLGAASTFEPYFLTRSIQPIYSKMAREFEKQSGASYYREKLSSGFKLVRDDFDYIKAIPFETELFIYVLDSTDFFSTYEGMFFKTACKWDDDSRSVLITMDPNDEYVAVLAGLDKVYNLITIAPQLQEIIMRRRPLIQVYIAGDRVLTNILGGTYWEQELQIDPQFDDSVLTGTYKFTNTKNIIEIISSYAPLLSTDVTDTYTINVGIAPTQWDSDNGLYYISTDHTSIPGAERLQLKRVSDNVVIYETQYYGAYQAAISDFPFNGVGGETGSFYFTEYRIYVRLATDLLEVSATPTYAVPDPDIVQNNANYRRVIGFNVTEFYTYDEAVTFPTKFGRVPDDTPNAGMYYKEFLVSVGTGLSNPVPVSASNWRAVGLWFFNDIDIRYSEFIWGEDVKIRDTFPLHSVINTLLKEMGSNVRFEATAAYSEFLYAATNPLGSFTFLDFDGGTLSTANVGNLDWFLTPKSNVTSGLYNQAAQKADASLGQIFNMLKFTLKCDWHIQSGKLRIEHISWYQNGGSYTSPILGTDLTTLINVRNGKNWNFGQNKYDYDKEAMPERIDFGWMDDVSPPFEGFPIKMRSKYVQLDKVDDYTVQGITTDIDYMVANPQNVSRDGLAFIGCVAWEGAFRVPYIQIDMGYNTLMILQNGFLAWPYLHPKFHVYDLPTNEVNLNGEDVSLFDNKTQQRKQEVIYPALFKVDPYKLIRTALGDGMAQKLSIDMHSKMIRATIKHDTE